MDGGDLAGMDAQLSGQAVPEVVEQRMFVVEGGMCSILEPHRWLREWQEAGVWGRRTDWSSMSFPMRSCWTGREPASIGCHRNSIEGRAMGKLAVRALRVLARRIPVRDGVIAAIVAAALVWFAVTVLNAPGQRDDPGVTLIMGGVGVAILGVALIVLVLRMLLAQAVARDVEAAQMQAELDAVI